MDFYNTTWISLGNKFDLREFIVKASDIDELALWISDVSTYSIAERMSWASRRNATRVEDVTYSLMGIFDVNMPMFYGEGSKAFIRLQEEILKHSDEKTIFAWSAPISKPYSAWEAAGVDKLGSTGVGLLAPSPSAFRHCRRLESTRIYGRPGFTLTSQGLSGRMTIVQHPVEGGVVLALLNASFDYRDRPKTYVGIYLRRGQSNTNPTSQVATRKVSEYLRVSSSAWIGLGRDRWEGDLTTWSSLRPSDCEILVGSNIKRQNCSPDSVHGFELTKIIHSRKKWLIKARSYHLVRRKQIRLASDTVWQTETAVLSLGSRQNARPVCNLRFEAGSFQDISLIQFVVAQSVVGPAPACIIVDQTFVSIWEDTSPGSAVTRNGYKEQGIPSWTSLCNLDGHSGKLPWTKEIVCNRRRWIDPGQLYIGFWLVWLSKGPEDEELLPLHFLQHGAAGQPYKLQAGWKVKSFKCPRTQDLQNMWCFELKPSSASLDLEPPRVS